MADAEHCEDWNTSNLWGWDNFRTTRPRLLAVDDFHIDVHATVRVTLRVLCAHERADRRMATRGGQKR